MGKPLFRPAGPAALASGCLVHGMGCAQKLTEMIPVALGRDDRTERFDDEQAVLLRSELDLIDDAARHDQIVQRAKGAGGPEGMQHTRALMDKEEFIGICVLIKIVGHGCPGCRQTDVQVVVEEHHFARLEEIVSSFR